MLKGIHFLLTYKCTSECDHCFLYCSPNSEGTFTVDQIQSVLSEAAKHLRSVEWVYFEGGEPFLFYPLLLEGVKFARKKGYKIGLVTNAYFATCEKDAMLWLKPLAEAGIDNFSVSDDEFHNSGPVELSPARIAAAAAGKLGMVVDTICIEKPAVENSAACSEPGQPVTGGSVMFRGRAVEKLAGSAPGQQAELFDKCPHEDLVSTERVHLDPFGNVHICQGISLGNMWQEPLPAIVSGYKAEDHPVCGPLAAGGPFLLARKYGVLDDERYANACHLCYNARLALLDFFPDYLLPRQVYGR